MRHLDRQLTISTNKSANMRSSRAKNAFTLVELLVVISIILIVSSILFLGGGGGDGAALSSSARITSGIAKGARGQAILKNSKTRLIIHNDLDQNVDKYRRYFGIVYADPDDPDQSNPTSWIAATQGTYLPEGIYFDPAMSASNGSGNTWTTAAEMTIDYPRSVASVEGTGESFYYYEFNSNGSMSTSPINFQNAWLVIRAGTLRPNGSGVLDVVFDEDKEFLRTALIFRRVGTTTPVNDPGAIQ